MKTVVLALSGRIASGKSTVALRLAERLKCARASFSDYVRTVAGERGLEPLRDNLQELGAELIASGWEPFCRAVLDQSGWQPGQTLVVEGIRHVEAVTHLKRLVAPLMVILVHLHADEQVRKSRLTARSMSSGSATAAQDDHSTENDVKALLPRLADLELNAANPVDQLVEEIVNFAAHTDVSLQ